MTAPVVIWNGTIRAKLSRAALAAWSAWFGQAMSMANRNTMSTFIDYYTTSRDTLLNNPWSLRYLAAAKSR